MSLRIARLFTFSCFYYFYYPTLNVLSIWMSLISVFYLGHECGGWNITTSLRCSMYITIPYSPGFFLKSCTCLFSGMKFQPVRDKYTLPPTNILYPKKHPFLLGYRIPFFSDANYVCSMMSTSFKGWVCGGSKKKHREHDAGGILEVEKKTVKSQISDFFFLGWIRYVFQFWWKFLLFWEEPSSTYPPRPNNTLW